MYGYGVDYWVIKNLANPNVAYESKKLDSMLISQLLDTDPFHFQMMAGLCTLQ